MKGAKTFMYVALGLLFAASAFDQFKGKEKTTVQPIPKPDTPKGKTVIGWDWIDEHYKYIDEPQPLRSSDLSDEEIRILREKQSYKSDGSYIYTPGRRVKSREREMQDYIDDNIDDILENYTP